MGKGPENFFPGRGVGGSGDIENSGKDAPQVAIQRGDILVKGDRSDGGGGIAPNARQLPQLGQVAGQLSAKLTDDDLGGAMQVAGAAVVAQALPGRENALFGGGGQGLKVGELFQPALIIGDDGFNACLLEHDF